jgi:hypothetical protein
MKIAIREVMSATFPSVVNLSLLDGFAIVGELVLIRQDIQELGLRLENNVKLAIGLPKHFNSTK